MGIEVIRLENFKAFKSVEFLDIPAFCVLVGANGTGKTTLFEVFGFLRDCLTYNVRSAVQRLGGMNELLSRGSETRGLMI